MKNLTLILSLFVITGFLFSCSSSKSNSSSSDNSQSNDEQKALDEAGVTQDDISTALKQTLEMSNTESEKELKSDSSPVLHSIFGKDRPKPLQDLFKALDQVGQSDEVQALTGKISEAVSSIISGASDIITEEINGLDMQDAYRILKAGNSSATDFLKDQSEPQIKAELDPIVEKALNSTGALEQWNELLEQYKALTGKDLDFNLVDYISDSVVNDMFSNMAEQEAKIRVNAYLWKTFIMKVVFKMEKR